MIFGSVFYGIFPVLMQQTYRQGNHALTPYLLYGLQTRRYAVCITCRLWRIEDVVVREPLGVVGLLLYLLFFEQR